MPDPVAEDAVTRAQDSVARGSVDAHLPEDRRGLYGHATVSDGSASAESVFRVMATDGIVGHSPEQTLQNIGALSTQGMVETDRTILKIMPDRMFEGV